MADKIKVSSGEGGFWIAVALLFIAFLGEPDLTDALIFHLTGDETVLESPESGKGGGE